MPIPTQRLLFGPVLVALCAVAWAALVAWELSPYAHHMHEEPLGAPSLACARPAPLVHAALFVGGWVLMTLAMMLPTTLPLVTVFARLTRLRPDRALLALLLVAGYLVVWTAFGVAAHALYLALHSSLEGSGWLWANSWIVGALGLALAGAFQTPSAPTLGSFMIRNFSSLSFSRRPYRQPYPPKHRDVLRRSGQPRS